jgi:hypothetical protein
VRVEEKKGVEGRKGTEGVLRDSVKDRETMRRNYELE